MALATQDANKAGNQRQNKMRQIPTATDAGGGGTSGGGTGTGGGGGGSNLPPHQPMPGGGSGQFGTQYQGSPAFTGGPAQPAIPKAGQSFSDTTRLQGALPFWQSPGVQVAGMQGYNPGQQFAGQGVTGESISGSPLVSAALANFNQNVMPGIEDKFNTMGLGRSSAAGNAMAGAQAQMLTPIYQQMAGLENERLQRQTQQGQFDSMQGQQEIDRLLNATTDETNRRERSSVAQTQGQQQLFENMMAMDQMRNAQTQSGAGQLFDMGGQARDYAQQGNQAQYQDFLRRMGLSEEALNPFGGFQNMLGTVTTGKG